MSIVLIREELADDVIDQLQAEFPFLQFETADPHDPHAIPDELWAKVEILYSKQLSSEELAKAVRLSWIHVPSPYLDQLPMEEIRRRHDLLVSETLEEHSEEAALFAVAVILGYAKNLFAWREATHSRTSLDQAELAHKNWPLEHLTLLQIGLGSIGGKIAQRAQQIGLRIVGVREKTSFHPYCQKVLSRSQMNTALPSADIVALTTGREGGFQCRIGREELRLMKEGSGLIIIGTAANIDQQALIDIGKEGKFRGIALDLYFPEDTASIIPALWQLPNLILTPAIAAYPPNDERETLRLFRYNLRQFEHENHRDMKNLIRRPSIVER